MTIRTLCAALMMPALVACSGLGDPVIPGQHVMACVNLALGTDAPPPRYVQVARSEVKQPYDAWFREGVVYLTRDARDARLAAHEGTRQAIWFTYKRPPTKEEFNKAERLCDAPRLPKRAEVQSK